jgi:hypothetical protein
MPARRITPAKAKEMLKNPPRGRALTTKQRGLFGLIASGKRPRKGV